MRYITYIHAVFLSLLLCLGYTLESFGQTVMGSNGGRQDVISEQRYTSLNGVEQWITIEGNPLKPVLLVIHGGPGSTISPFDGIFNGAWKKDFLVVQWDQRGAGRTYGKGAPAELTPEYIKSRPLTVDQFVSDGIELTEYLIRHLRKRKVILFGTSWGSVVGAKMAMSRPDLYSAYIGHSQVVNPTKSSHTSYQTVLGLAASAKDQQSIDVLKGLGEPPYDDARNTGKFIRVIKKYEAQRSVAAPEEWFRPAPDYDNAKDEQHRADGDDYSFVHYAGDKRFGITGMAATIDLSKQVDFKVPVYLIQGDKDILTPKEETKRYFDLISAPEKKYFLVQDAAHGFNQSVINKLYDVAMSISRKR